MRVLQLKKLAEIELKTKIETVYAKYKFVFTLLVNIFAFSRKQPI